MLFFITLPVPLVLVFPPNSVLLDSPPLPYPLFELSGLAPCFFLAGSGGAMIALIPLEVPDGTATAVVAGVGESAGLGAWPRWWGWWPLLEVGADGLARNGEGLSSSSALTY